MSNVDRYIEEVVKIGDMGSNFLAKESARTLRNNKFVDVLKNGMNGISVLRPGNYFAVVHSLSGDPRISEPKEYSASCVDKLVEMAIPGSVPVAFANVIDSNNGEIPLLGEIMKGLTGRAEDYGLAILNGENAVLGKIIAKKANVSCTMVSFIDANAGRKLINGRNLGKIIREGINYGIFDPEGKAIYMNSDGVGTKTDCYARNGTFSRALSDSAAMKLDDKSKIGASSKVLSDVVEFRGEIPQEEMENYANALSQKYGFVYLLQFEDVWDRLSNYEKGAPSFNISGSAVSTIDENRLRNPLVPRENEFIFAVRGHLNPRSNGITARREILEKVFGKMWHTKPEASMFLDYLTQPSNNLSFLFDELIEKNLATSVFHLSGGAYNGKLARPLAKQKLFAKLEGLFEPHSAEEFFIKHSGGSVANAYGKWSMGVDGFITTKAPYETIKIILNHGYETKCVGVTEKRKDGKTGVELKAYNGEMIYFSGN